MGQACIKKQQRELAEEEPELIFKEYKSSFDQHYTKIEQKYNYLQYFQLYEFLLLVTNYKAVEHQDESKQIGKNLEVNQNNTRVKKEYLQEITKADWATINRNKIMNNFIIQTLVVKSDTDSAIFTDFMENLFDVLLKGFITLYKHKNPGVSVKKGQITTLKKLYLFPFALLFCHGKNVTKVGLLYDLFLDESGNFSRSIDLDYFLFILFVIPSTATLNVLFTLGNKYEEQLGKLSQETYNKLNDPFEIKDIERLMEIFYREFFKGEEKLSKRAYDQRFANGEFGWIFNANGIRLFLETNNDVKTDVNKDNA